MNEAWLEFLFAGIRLFFFSSLLLAIFLAVLEVGYKYYKKRAETVVALLTTIAILMILLAVYGLFSVIFQFVV